MKCLSCGNTVDDDSVFCSRCGKKIELPAADDEAAEIAPAIGETAENAAEQAEERVEDTVSDAAEEAVEAAPVIEEAAVITQEQAEETADETSPDVSEEAAEAEPVIGEAAVIASELTEETVPETVPADSDDTVAAIDEALEALSSTAEENETAEGEPSEAADTAVPELKPLKRVEAPKEEPIITNNADAAAPLYVQNEINGNVPPQTAPEDLVQQPYAPYSASQEPIDVPDESGEAAVPVKVGALRITFAGFIAIITIVFLTLLTVMFSFKAGATGKILKKRTEKMNISTVLDADYGKTTLSDAIYNETGFGEASHGEVSKADFRAYLSKSDLLEFAGGTVKDYADYMLEGETSDPSLSANDLTDFFIGNSELADETFSYTLETADYNKIRSKLEEKNTAENFSIEKWSETIHFNLENTSFIFSYVTLGIILGLVVVLLVWIAVIVDGKGRHIVGLYGSIFSCSGGIVLLAGLATVAGTAIAHIITGWFIFYLIASLFLPFGVLMVCIGAAEFAVGFVFKRIRRGIRNSDKRNKAVEKALMGAGV